MEHPTVLIASRAFTYWRISRNFVRTWSKPTRLRYEPGIESDSKDSQNVEFLSQDQAYSGNNIIRHTGGTLIRAVAHANAPGDAKDAKRPWKTRSLCFVGKWNAEKGNYRREVGKRVEISPDHSVRGLLEPEVAELRDSRVMVV